jgi:SAM-dependent methyltransferase
MLKRFSPARLDACLAEAAAARAADPSVAYPGWYLQRWHFLPEGYLSTRSVRLYERFISRLYHAGREGAVLARLGALLARRGAGSVLELGCGPGHALLALAEALPTARLAGADLSPFMVEAARTRLAGRAAVDHGGAAAALIAARVDAVVALHLLGHMPAREAGRVLQAAREALNPGGSLVLVEHAWHRLPLRGWRAVHEERFASGVLQLRVFEPAP